MRRRHSTQVLDLEAKVEQLAAENRILADAKAQAEVYLEKSQHATSALADRDAEIDSLKTTLDWLHREVSRLTEVNEGLTSANITMGNQHNERYNMLETQHMQAIQELESAREAQGNLSVSMNDTVRKELDTALQEKDRQIAQLQAELEDAKERIREMQRQILASKSEGSEFLVFKDEDYFDTACQQL
jgi:chromosome segregation ATPase